MISNFTCVRQWRLRDCFTAYFITHECQRRHSCCNQGRHCRLNQCQPLHHPYASLWCLPWNYAKSSLSCEEFREFLLIALGISCRVSSASLMVDEDLLNQLTVKFQYYAPMNSLNSLNKLNFTRYVCSIVIRSLSLPVARPLPSPLVPLFPLCCCFPCLLRIYFC